MNKIKILIYSLGDILLALGIIFFWQNSYNMMRKQIIIKLQKSIYHLL